MTETDTSDTTTDPRYQQSGKAARPGPIIAAITAVVQFVDGVMTKDGVEVGEDLSRFSPKRGWLPSLDLPGFGEMYDDCGDDLPHFCEICGHVQSFGRTCSRSVCPRCAPSWVLRAASGRGRDSPGIVPRLVALKKLKQATTPHKQNQKFHHLVISPPKDWRPDTDDPLETTFNTIKSILDELRTEGLVAYHPYRGKHEEPGADDRGEWRRRLFSDLEWSEVKEELKFSPHFHVVCVADHIKGEGVVERVEEETGWVIARIVNEDGHSVAKNEEDKSQIDPLARVVTYVLSHAGLYETPSGQMRAAYRMVGKDLNGIEVFDETDKEARLAVRKAAPKTLGIPAPRLACDAQVPAVPDPEDLDGEDGQDHDAVTATAMAAAGGGGGGGGGAALPADNGGSTIGRLPNVPGDSTIETEPCNGAFLSIGAAPSMLDDDEWTTQARHVEEVRAALDEWRQIEDWIG